MTVRVTAAQSRAAARRGLSAPSPGGYEAVRAAGARTVRYRNVKTGDVVSRRQIDNAVHGASYETRARTGPLMDAESPIKRYYRAVKRARTHDPTLSLAQARRQVSRRRRDGFSHFVSSYMQRHGSSRAKAEHEVRKALAVPTKNHRANETAPVPTHSARSAASEKTSSTKTAYWQPPDSKPGKDRCPIENT